MNKLLLLAFLILALANSTFAQKTDIVILNNGDNITGEIKRLQYAKLEFKTDAMNTIFIRWEDIYYIWSDKHLQIEFVEGVDRFGMIETDTLSNGLLIGIGNLATSVAMDSVVAMVPIEEEFWDRLKGSLDLGASFTKASEVGQLSLSGNANLRTQKYLRDLSFSSVTTAQKDRETTENHNFNISVMRFYSYHWFVNWFASAQKNTELKLDLRLSGGAGGGRDIIRTNSTVLSASVGLQATREWTRNVSQPKTNAEGVLQFSFKKFKYTTPKLDWNTEVSAYPNITTKDRIRIDFDSKLRWEIISDLNWGLQLYYNFDSRSPESNSEKTDYGTIISLGYSFS